MKNEEEDKSAIFKHTYKQTGEYRVKIWSDEIKDVYMPLLLNGYKEFHFGNCTILEKFYLDGFKDKTLDINGCSAFTELYISNCETLELINANKCSEFSLIYLYSNSKLTMCQP